MNPKNEPWWRRCSAVLRYMPEYDKKTIADITAELTDIRASGYQAIQITAPYASSGFYPWWGLRPYDYFSLNSALGGSISDFAALVEQCHRHDLRVILFLNLGYADVFSPLWQKACQNRCSEIRGTEDGLFLWSNTDASPADPPGTPHFLQDGYWHWSDDASCFCRCFWTEGDIAEPQYDWQKPEVHDYFRRVLDFWLTTGINGIIVDAVNHYLNGTMPVIRRCITDVIHEYADTMCIPEGGTGFSDSFVPWLTEGGFDMIEDQTFHSDLHWNGSAVMNALNTGNPNLLDNALAVCRAVRSMGSACWSYLSWGDAWTPDYRLFEIALLIASGHMTEIIPSYLHGFLPEHRRILNAVLQMTRFRSLAPSCERRRLPVGQANTCYAFLCVSEDPPVLCVFNLSDTVQDVHIPVHGTALPPVSEWFDHIMQCRLPMRDGVLSVNLPPHGFVLALPYN